MSDLEVRQLRYFLAVAEELHFGRAAERLGMTQPPLSRAIDQLERQLGVSLLERSTRRVSLTPAGGVLLREGRKALNGVAAAERRTRQAGRTVPQLHLALKADYDGGLLPAILRVFEGDPAALPVELVLGGRGEQVPALHDGRADVALLPTPFDDEGLDTVELLTEPRLVALAAGDPLAERTRLSLAELAGRKLPDGTPAELGVTPTALTSYDDLPVPVPSEGPAPSSAQGRHDLAAIFSLVELGRVVLFVPASVARRHPRADLCYREVIDLEPATLTVAWPEASRSVAVAAFVRAAGAAAEEESAREPVVLEVVPRTA